MMKTTIVIKMDQRDPDLLRLREVGREAKEGKIIAFPTETVYGIGGPMFVRELEQALVQIKNRGSNKPFSYHIGELGMLGTLDVPMTPEFRFLIKQFWPGPLTLLVKNRSGQKIGIRYPRHRVTAALINSIGVPFLGTSANVSGEASPRSAEEVMAQMDGKIDYLIDAGRCELGQDSTIVDLSETPPKILRKGAMADAVEKAVQTIQFGHFPKKKILFVCTGNSCRSPMAAALLVHQLKRQRLGQQIEVASCGIGARAGLPATMEAILTMKNHEMDLSDHRSKPCAREDILQADLILVMSQEHAAFIQNMLPQARLNLLQLNIPDPIGMGMLIYEQVLSGIEKKLKELWPEIVRLPAPYE